ncbi:hydantoinase/oxoprolinase family protein [Salinirubrum litoreum]|uniref:Hydantoinase/oxoprolinase family protein n=1 Tax=Salinirubrum litoreum TaxID=1126234 RepID=A0ABD5R8W2_9EURY|nr:hydantoinase/oxoprolinase family protein [Salinirubrum litoreum]
MNADEAQSPVDHGPRIGVDVGGTFTDLVVVADGAVHSLKVPSTPDAPEQGVLDAVAAAERESIADPTAISFCSHGTTVATNAVLEGEWAETALLTTEGFRDALEIGRQNRPDIYDFRAEKPDPVVPRDRRFEVPERLDERGNVLRDLDESAVTDLADRVRDTGAESVAVCLLFAFENGTHERRVAEILREAGVETPISLSSVVLPEIREYERTLTTALNAALVPVMDDYLAGLVTGLRDAGITAPLTLMASNGGTLSGDAARERPVNTLLSGPAGGVQGAAFVAGRAGYDDLLTMDMGGTSCDVSLVRDGDPLVTTETEVGDYPIGVPSVDVHTVGAGGGSLAWVDAGGALRVGPKSAGADPGPICYGRGGEQPTTTDAHYLLGRIDPDAFVADLAVERRTVADAVRQEVADDLGLGVREAAQGVLDVANANMERALRVVSVERGHDPRDFALVAFGGAGPLHAATLAESLDIPEVVIPPTAGVLSALGLLVSDLVTDDSTSRVRRWSEVDPASLTETFADFAEQGRARLADESPAEIRTEPSLDLRYVGQSYELSVPVPEAVTDGGNAGTDPVPIGLDSDDLDAIADRFHERHRERYGHASPDEPLELVTIRLRTRGVVEPPDIAPARTEGRPDDAVRTTRAVGFDGTDHETPVYDRDRLPAGGTFAGPAVVEGSESTTVVRPGQQVRVADDGTMVVEVDP